MGIWVAKGKVSNAKGGDMIAHFAMQHNSPGCGIDPEELDRVHGNAGFFVRMNGYE